MLTWYITLKKEHAAFAALFGAVTVISVCCTIVALYGPDRPPMDPLQKCTRSLDMARTAFCENLTRGGL